MLDKNNRLSLCDQFNGAASNIALVFDLDNTIVDISSLYGQMETIFTDFLAKRLQISHQDAHFEVLDMLKRTYYIQDEALRRHNIPVADTLKVTYDPQSLDFRQLKIEAGLDLVLASLRPEKYLFTNATEDYAKAVLDHLGIKKHFNGIAGTDNLHYLRKPHGGCYDAFEARFGIENKDVHFFEDTAENLDAAYFLKGWHGHVVNGYRKSPAYARVAQRPYYVLSHLDTLLDLKN